MSTLWRTPPELFNRLNERFKFKVDAAASKLDHLLPTWYGPGSEIAENALELKKWHSLVWCNPPYGSALQPFLDKFIEQGGLGVSIVALIPAYTGEHWFTDKVRPYADLIFLKGRVPFNNPCEHCEGTGKCEEIVESASGPTCCFNNICEVCSGTTIDPKPSQPRFGSALALYGPGYRGRVEFWDWKRNILG